MKSDNGRSVSVWMATQDTPAGPRVAEDLACDVCVVGSGIAGLTTAYLLSREGKKVVVLDDGPTAGGETSRTTAHLVFYNDDGMSKIEQLHGTEGLKLATDSHAAAVDKIEQIAREEHIDCDFYRVNGYLFITPGGQGMEFLKEELAAAHRVGRTEAHFVVRAPLSSFDTGPCLCYPNQGQFHPLKYLSGLAMAIRRNGGEIHNQTHVSSVTGGSPAKVETSTGRVITAGAVVVATNTPVNDLVTMHTKLAAYRTYVLGFKVRKGAIPRNLYWDTLDPYHYVRLQELDDEFEVLIAGGEDHKTGQANDPARRYDAIERWTRQRFPQAGQILFHWSGQVMEPVDCLAYIGRNPGDADNVFIATGDSGMGMTHGTIAGMLLSDLILGRSNEWEKLYSPARTPLKSATTFVRENLNVAKEYGQWLTPGEAKSTSEIAPDTGAILRRGLAKVACYRDAGGQLHEFSAVCPHLQCVVNWNGAEKTWDCPCHGSRFDAYGQVVNGPANSNLEPLTKPILDAECAMEPRTAASQSAAAPTT
jgi:glycine/D-amino acid oxidase-like deaminating enzyme/nitrite reductase/ring-hydroxylating ferredoxin subunit